MHARDPRQASLRAALLSAPGLLWVTLFLLLPLVLILGTSFLSRGEYGQLERPFTLENYQRFAGFGSLGFDPLYPLIIARSLLLGAATTGLCVLAGLPLAFFVAGLPRRLKTPALTLVVIPLWTNLLIRTYAWQILLAPEGWLTRCATALGLLTPGQSLYPGTLAVCVGMVCDFLPFLVLPLYASVEKIEWTLAEAARDLGAGGWATFRHALLPQIRPGLMAGGILTFIPATGQFVVPDLLGGAKTVLLGNVIQQQFGQSHDWPFGSAVAVLSMTVVLAGLWLYARAATQQGEGLFP